MELGFDFGLDGVFKNWNGFLDEVGVFGLDWVCFIYLCFLIDLAWLGLEGIGLEWRGKGMEGTRCIYQLLTMVDTG